MSEHLTRLEILEYVEDAEYVNHVAVTRHLGECAECRGVLHELEHLVLFFEKNAELFRFADLDEADLDPERVALWENLLNDDECAVRDAHAADAFFLELAQQPPETWDGVIATRPEVCTPALVLRLVDAAAPELDRKPEHAMILLRVAELVAYALYDAESRRALGHVWKQRSNALRMLGQYEDAIDAAIMAENFYASLTEPDTAFEVGQARYTMAVTLFKMTRYAAALQALTSARSALEPFGITAPLAKTLMLDAVIRIEQGEVTAARQTLRELLPIEQRLGQALEAARVRTNLAECNLRLGDLDVAMEDAEAAITMFRDLGNTAEEMRSEWTKAMIHLARGDDAGLGRLYEITAAYRELGMMGEAGFVQLDITEELLRREEWAEAANIARDLVLLFASAGVTLASVNAVDYLRRAVENRAATAEVVQYIRSYVSADDPARPFDPPLTATN
jgi:tetratricopeptide (TPR) repeat protein